VAEPASARVKVRRHPERASYERQAILDILDEGLICHLGLVEGGSPICVPTMYARLGDAIYIHGSPASRMLRTARDGGTDVCLTVTLLDGLVMARSAFKHSMNYRSAMVLGKAVEVSDPAEKMIAFEALLEHVCRGRWADIRPPSKKELKATLVLRLPLAEASAKIRSGGPVDDADDLDLPAWAGEIPLRVTPREPLPAGDRPLPAYAGRYTRPGWDV
jgi:nitroimidazol reductase NimA-like FMN-containing flavoprotein (pyridoxamine 5'-phosphate oxidase superfamily)